MVVSALIRRLAQVAATQSGWHRGLNGFVWQKSKFFSPATNAEMKRAIAGPHCVLRATLAGMRRSVFTLYLLRRA
jgi:hypothetical protein